MKKVLMLAFLLLGTTVMTQAATPATKMALKEATVVKHKKNHKMHKAQKEEVKKVESSKKQ